MLKVEEFSREKNRKSMAKFLGLLPRSTQHNIRAHYSDPDVVYAILNQLIRLPELGIEYLSKDSKDNQTAQQAQSISNYYLYLKQDPTN